MKNWLGLLAFNCLMTVFFVPGYAFAQTPASDHIPSASPLTAEESELAVLNGEMESDLEERPKTALPPNRWGSGLLQTGGALLGGIGLAIVGAGFCSVLYDESDFDGDTCLILGGAPGVAIGSALGAWVTGESIGWDGSFLATLGGSLVGAAVFSGLAYLIDPDLSEVGMGLFILGVPAAGAVGYQLSADWNSGAIVLSVPKATMVPVFSLDF